MSAETGRRARAAEEIVRATDEYAAAFDLEVWKAQQQARFRQQLRQAKETLEQRITAELAQRERARIAELDRTQEELERMARRIQAANEVLQRRTEQLEAREAVFESRRVRVAEQHEAHLSRVEDRAKRGAEEAVVMQETLRSQLREKDTVILQLQEKLRAAETEYDMLRRKTARHLMHSATDSDSQRVRDLECQLASATTALRDAQVEQQQRTQEATRIGRERDALELELNKCRVQLEELGGRYTKAQEQALAREREWLRAERERLDERGRQEQLAAQCVGSASSGSGLGRGQRRITFSDVVGSHIPASFATGGAVGQGSDGLYGMIRDLKDDVSASLAPGAASTGRYGAQGRQTFVYAECARKNAAYRHRDVTQTRGQDYKDRGTAPAESFVSPFSTPRSERRHQEDHDDGDDEEDHCRRDAAPEPAVTVNTSTHSYNPVEVESWHSGATVGGLPPLAPAPRHQPYDESVTVVSPLPEEFVKAAASAVVSGPETTLEDMRTFVAQLKINRQKLLDTGVYEERHAVVVEMTNKIALYEQYLHSHSQQQHNKK